MGTIDLLHFDRLYQHARHYPGYTTDLTARLTAHHHGTGARLLTVLRAHGIGWSLGPPHLAWNPHAGTPTQTPRRRLPTLPALRHHTPERKAMTTQHSVDIRGEQRPHRRSVVWGCSVHRTPAGTECQGCADQGELITWDDIRRSRRGATARTGVRRHH
jgi:hypothetical protein